MKSLGSVLLTASILAAGACAADNGPSGHITLPGMRGTSYKVTANGIYDAEVSISRVENKHEFRGVIGTTTEIELRVEGDMIKGERGGVPIDLKLSRNGAELVVQGSYGGKMVAAHILKEPGMYCTFRYNEGPQPSSCRTEPNRIPLPDLMQALPEGEQAAFVVVAFYK